MGSFKLGVCHGHQIVPWGDAESLGAPHLPPRAEPRYRMSATLLPPASPPLGCASPAAHAAATHTHAHAHTHTRVRTCTHVRAGAMQRQLDCDILVSGHTHRFSAYESGARTTTARPPLPAHHCPPNPKPHPKPHPKPSWLASLKLHPTPRPTPEQKASSSSTRARRRARSTRRSSSTRTPCPPSCSWTSRRAMDRRRVGR